MDKQNIHWPTYLATEEEMLDLTYDVHFDDSQIWTYSLRIADMILKISSEIESVANDIYRRHTCLKPTSASKCLKWMEDNWQITKKHVSLIAPSMYFVRNFQPSFTPFQYRNDSSDDYYKAYCAIKHDKSKNLAKANINSLVRCLASLYLLNLYWGGDDAVGKNHSKIFSAAKAGLGIGLFIDFGINMAVHMRKCVKIDLYHSTYYFYREEHRAEIKKLVDALSREGRKKLRDYIQTNSDNPYFLIGKLIQIADASTTVGNFLVKQNKVASNFYGSPETTRTFLNYGYTRVYFSKQDMQKQVKEVSAESVCDRFDVSATSFSTSELI